VNRRLLGLIAACVAALLLLLPAAAYAASPVPADTIIVPRNASVAAVFSLDRPVIVSGTVQSAVVAIGSNVTLTKQAQTPFVLIVGGRLRQAPSAHVTQGVIAIRGNPWTDSVLTVSGLLYFGAYFGWAGALAALFVILVAFGQLVSHRDLLVTELIGQKSLRMIGLGLLTTIAVALIAVAGVISSPFWIVGAVITGLYAIAGVIGLIFVSNALGRLLRGRIRTTVRIPVVVVGALAVALTANVPLVGPLAFALLWCVGIGALWMIIFQPRLVRPSTQTPQNMPPTDLE
jgi:hypothetical protein